MDLIKNKQITVDDYKKNVYIIDLFADILNSLLRHNRESFTMREYLQPYLAKDKTFVNFSLNDIKPFLKHAIVLPSICARYLKW